VTGMPLRLVAIYHVLVLVCLVLTRAAHRRMRTELCFRHVKNAITNAVIVSHCWPMLVCVLLVMTSKTHTSIGQQ